MSLFARLRAGSRSAVLIPYKYVKLRSGLPGDLDAYQNAKDVVAEKPGHRVVRGWLLFQDGILDKHVIVEDVATGERFDITPLERRVPFFEHPGTADEFEGLSHQISMPAYLPPVRLATIEASDEDEDGGAGASNVPRFKWPDNDPASD